MPEVSISIGGREFLVACQAGEEEYLRSAAAMLDHEVAALAGQAGRMTEARMLLMAGLLLADKTAGLEDKLRDAEARLSEAGAAVEALRTAPTPAPERIEVPMVPPSVTDTLAELAAQAESIAEALETRADT
jgi:cell division protein ZapA